MTTNTDVNVEKGKQGFQERPAQPADPTAFPDPPRDVMTSLHSAQETLHDLYLRQETAQIFDNCVIPDDAVYVEITPTGDADEGTFCVDVTAYDADGEELDGSGTWVSWEYTGPEEFLHSADDVEPLDEGWRIDAVKVNGWDFEADMRQTRATVVTDLLHDMDAAGETINLDQVGR